MTDTTARPGEPGGQPAAKGRPPFTAALDSAEELLRAHLDGRELSDDARLTLSSSLAQALRDLYCVQLAAQPGGSEAQRASDGLQRFDKLLRQVAEAGLLPGR